MTTTVRTVTREYDAEGRLVKETEVETTYDSTPATWQPSPAWWQQPLATWTSGTYTIPGTVTVN